jgi:hypothetical protein
VRVEFYMTFEQALVDKIHRAAEARDIKPADLVEKVIEVVFRDNIVAAVLD